MPLETIQLIEFLKTAGWVNSCGNGIVWNKNGTSFDVIADCVSDGVDGSFVSFQKHGEGIRFRFNIAERLASTGW